jgi:hypothetical protein
MYKYYRRDNVVGILTGLRPRQPTNIFPNICRRKSGPALHNAQKISGVHTAFFSMCTGIISPRVKLPGRKAKKSLSANAEIKND